MVVEGAKMPVTPVTLVTPKQLPLLPNNMGVVLR